MFGYHARYLRIDLTAGTAAWVPLAEDVLRRFIGGVGLGTWLLHRESPPGVEPLAPAAADALWGRPTDEATAWLGERFGPDYPCAVIGPAGETLVRSATISHDHRHAGRGGLGAVLGAKRLKAVAVAGSQRVPVADPEGVV